MKLEERIIQELEIEQSAVPPRVGSIDTVIAKGRRRKAWANAGIALASAAVVAAAIGVAAWAGSSTTGPDVADEIPEGWSTWTGATDGLVEECACQMEMAEDGTIWLVGLDGASRFNGADWEFVELPQPFSGEGWPAVAAAPDGSVWVLGMSYIAQYVDGEWATVAPAEHANRGGELGPVWFQGLEVDDDGLVWTNYEDVDGVILDGAFTPRERNEAPSDDGFIAPEQMTHVATAPDGTEWMTMGDALFDIDGALISYDGAAYTRHDLGGVSNVAFEPDGTGWFVVREIGPDAWIYGAAQWSEPGLYRFEDGEWFRITTADGLAGYRLSAMFMAPDGALWLSTADGTVTRYQPGTDPQAGTPVEIESRPFAEAEFPGPMYPPITEPPAGPAPTEVP